jgi:hypothetical protein
MADSPEQPKIVIDSDWKAQAQKERERLAAKEKEAQEKAKVKPIGAAAGGLPGGPENAGGDPHEQGMPPPDFQALVGTMVTQCLLYMGGFPDPQTGRAIVSLEHARFHIDLLATLEEKTKGNLTEDEATDLKMALNELRMRFVEIVKAVAQASKEGRLGRPGGGGAAGVTGPVPGPGMMGAGGISGPGM